MKPRYLRPALDIPAIYLHRDPVDFRKPARLEDELAVSVRVQFVGRARMDFTQQIRRGDDLLIEAAVRAADWSAALTEIAALPEAAQAPLAEWQTAAQTRAAATTALSDFEAAN